MGKRAPKPPDYSRQIEAQMQMGRESLDFYKQTYYGDLLPRQQRQDALAEDAIRRQNESADLSMQYAREDRARYNSQFAPIEAAMAAEALGLDPDAAARAAQQGGVSAFSGSDIAGATQRLYERQAGAGMADVAQSYANAEAQLGRTFGRMGVNPNSGVGMAMANNNAISKATDMANVGNQARFKAEQMQWSKRADVANMGRGMLSSNATQTGLGLQATQGAMGTSLQNTQSGAATANFVGQGYNLGMQGVGNSANIANMGFGNRMQAANVHNQAVGGIGQLAGVALAGAATGGFGLAGIRR